nr:hypothetical protein [Tanacetum cinerariifolium]
MFLVAFCLTCSRLRFDRCVLDCDLLEMFLAAICLKHSWLRFTRYALGCVLPEIWLVAICCVPGCVLYFVSLHFCLKGVNSDIMADMTAPTRQAPIMAPPVRTNDQILPRIRWVQTGYLRFSAK